MANFGYSSLMTAAEMSVAYALIVYAISASRGALTLMTTYFYGTIFETSCSMTKRSI